MQYDKRIDPVSENSTWFRIVLAAITCILLVVSIFLTGCAAPFSDLQSARTVGRNRVEVTPSISAVSFASEGETEHVQNHYGVQAAYGLGNSLDFRVRFERIALEGESRDPFDALGFGPKIGIVKDIIAINLPFGLALNDDIETSDSWQFHPTILFTPISGKGFEINTSAKALIPLSSEDSDTLIALNVGAGVSTNMDKWSIRPEIGFLINPGEEGYFIHASIGLAISP